MWRAIDDLAMLMLPPRDLPLALAILALAFGFTMGAVWGSFLNVVIARLPLGQSVVRPRSRCPSCGTQIRAHDNIPILSWLWLRARCRDCGAAISARYPFIELLMGLAGAAVVARNGISPIAAEQFVFIATLVVIAFIDLDTFEVHFGPIAVLVASGLLGAAIRVVGGAADKSVVIDRVIGALGGGVLLGSVVVIATAILRRVGSREGDDGEKLPGRIAPDEFAMGWGDPLILIGVGAHLGWRLLPAVLFFASVQGSVVGIVQLMRGGLDHTEPVSPDDDWVPPRGAIPFGPFLALGALECAFFAEPILGWLARLWGGG